MPSSGQSIGYSSDGVSWNFALNSSSILSSVLDIAWGVDKFVAVGVKTGNFTIAYSYDGVSWVGVKFEKYSGFLETEEEIRCVKWIENKFIICGNSSLNSKNIAYSFDGITWNLELGQKLGSIINKCYYITYLGNRYIAVGRGRNSIAYSTDAISWVNVRNVNPFFSIGKSVIFGKNIYVAVGYRYKNSDSCVAYSYDGEEWLINNTKKIDKLINDVIYGDGKFVIVGDNFIGYSNDGISWTSVNNSSNIFDLGRSVSYGNSKFVAVGKGNNSIAYSNDGINWTGIGKSLFTNEGLSVVWGNNKFVVIGSGQKEIGYSSDGISWTAVSDSNIKASQKLYDVAWGANKYVVIGERTNGVYTILYSYNGISWTGVENSKNNFRYINGTVSWVKDKFIAVGNNPKNGKNVFAYSIDGIS